MPKRTWLITGVGRGLTDQLLARGDAAVSNAGYGLSVDRVGFTATFLGDAARRVLTLAIYLLTLSRFAGRTGAG